MIQQTWYIQSVYVYMFIILEWTRNKNDEYCLRIAQQIMGYYWDLPTARLTKEQDHREYFRNISAPR